MTINNRFEFTLQGVKVRNPKYPYFYQVPNEDTLKWFPAYFYTDWVFSKGNLVFHTEKSAPKSLAYFDGLSIDTILKLTNHTNIIYKSNLDLLNTLPSGKYVRDCLVNSLLSITADNKELCLQYASVAASALTDIEKIVTTGLGLKVLSTDSSNKDAYEQLKEISLLSDSDKSLYIESLAQYKLVSFIMMQLVESFA